MMPLYNGNEYYKKMLELQERLRKSEEERIRLEERFSLLEHESRSRHETCINRLRMRYIDFLEQQQARDERNHQLLGALDRVDSSLARMTAKTDRLGALRKQYEASILARHEYRRPNGSVTGDSGVASQNDDGHRRSVEPYCGSGNAALAPGRNRPIGNKGRSNRTSGSASQVRPGSSYGSNWTGIRCESSPMHPSSFAFPRFSQGVKSHAFNRDNESSAGFNSLEPPTKFLSSKTSLDPPDSICQSLRHGNGSPLVSSNLEYRKNNLSPYQESDYAPHRSSTELGQNLKFGRSVARNLAASGAYDSIEPVPRSYNSAPAYFKDSYERTSVTRNSPGNNYAKILQGNSPDSDRISNSEDRKIRSSSPRSPKLCDILRQELGDEEEHIGHIVENQLERYISKIRSLHRVAEPQSLEEVDHEQNTSGDLLNVSLSDDGPDLPVEDKPRDRLLRQDLGNVLALASDLANQTATNAFNVANNMYQKVPPGDDVEETDARVDVVPDDGRNESAVPMAVPEEGHRLASINRLLDQTECEEKENVSRYEEHESLAKNGISGDVTKSHSELASRPSRNIHDIAKLSRSSEHSDQGKCASEGIGANPMNGDGTKFLKRHIISQAPEDKRDKFSRRSSVLHLLQGSRYKLASGEERENDENLHDVVADLEPWNLSALERRVHEIILNDEAQDDFVGRETARDADATSKHFEHERAMAGIEEEIVESEANEQTINDSIDENPYDPSWKNVEDLQDGAKGQDDSRLENQQSLPNPLDSLQNESLEKDTVSYQEEAIEDPNYGSVNADADSKVDYEQNQANTDYKNHIGRSYDEGYPDNSNVDYAYNAQGSYQIPDEQYPQYSSNDGVQYEENQGQQQYGYAEEQYAQDPDPQNYAQDPNQQTSVDNSNEENYVQDANQQNYVQDPNQQDYAQDLSQQDYVQDLNQQEYVQDANQPEWVSDPNQQYNVDDGQQFAQDPDNVNQQYSTESEQQIPADSNNQYLAAQQYSENQEYAAQSNEEYSKRDVNVQPYSNTGEYVQNEDEEYQARTTDNTYPVVEDYPNNEGYYRVQEDSTVPFESEENFQQSPERSTSFAKSNNLPQGETVTKKPKDVIKSILESDTDSTIEKNVSNTESDFDFN
ncbi:uncharacterized protein [Venturia canescens]|uniref:uncharacterized protein n=1 Tax=Venturia canescens TaxID=32260 RepID=UPI001C9BF083|nr:uncharacterized protein LOC122409484 [Venturia canescens]XP_043273028.1 uncharacterized protein LOC122409484 [Venturia canescens]